MREEYDGEFDPYEVLERLTHGQQDSSEHMAKLSIAFGQLVDLFNGLNQRISNLERAVDNINTLIYGNRQGTQDGQDKTSTRSPR